VAVSCAVLPVPTDTVAGEIVRESIVVLLPQPKNGTTSKANRDARTLRRPTIELSSSLKHAGRTLLKRPIALP
jgi:hypothetical protein